MPRIVLLAIIFFTSALIFYTIGVWSERLKKILKPWHLIFFWLGLITDTLGTYFVSKHTNAFTIDFHTITGTLGLFLMFIHTIWATYIIIKNQPKQLTNFHTFSVFVWLIWLIPYFTGLINGMTRVG